MKLAVEINKDFKIGAIEVSSIKSDNDDAKNSIVYG
jgi:hypothetical protein